MAQLAGIYNTEFSCACLGLGQWQIDKDATDVAMELGRAEMRAFFNSQF